MPVAMILNDDFYGRGLARVIIMLPWSDLADHDGGRLALGAERTSPAC